jgi:sporulation protein YlmC with PRC-barrel domain
VTRLEPRDMLGKSVLASDGQRVGAIKDVLMGRGGNRPTHLIVGSGGVLGLGDRDVALDIEDVRYARDRDAIVATKLTQEQFAALPEFRDDGTMVSLSRSRTTTR